MECYPAVKRNKLLTLLQHASTLKTTLCEVKEPDRKDYVLCDSINADSPAKVMFWAWAGMVWDRY